MNIQHFADSLEAELDAIKPNGLTRDQLMGRTGIPDVSTFHWAKRVLQEKLSGGTETVVGDSATNNYGGWTYSIQSQPDAAASRVYQIRKHRQIFGRLRTTYLVVAVLARGQGRTAVGRYTQRHARDLYAMMENTVDILVDLGAQAPRLPARII
jgi:hypothetical protein